MNFAGSLHNAFVAARLARPTGMLANVSWRRLPSTALALARAGLGHHSAIVIHAQQRPDDEALVEVGGARFTWQALDHDVARVANGLAQRGVRGGTRVGLLMRNRSALVIAQHALVRLGATAVQLGTALRSEELAHMLSRARPKLLMVDAALRPALDAAINSVGMTSTLITVDDDGPAGWSSLLRQSSPALRRPPGRTDSGAVMVFTSGTTGRPKGAERPWSQTGLEAPADLMLQLGIRVDERHLVACPLYHSAAPAFVAIMTMLGATTVIAASSDPAETLAVIERERITSTMMVPTMISRLAQLPPEVRAAHNTSSLRWVMSGAAPLAPDTAARFQAAYGEKLWNFYGATELGLVSLARPSDHAVRPGTVGKTLRGVTVAIRDAQGRAVPRGEVGELYAVSKTTFAGYYGDSAATEKAVQQGAFTVGDLARQDEDGYLYLASRTHDLVISGGVNIYPREIEDRLMAHPAIADAAVYGAPDDEWGELLVAALVLRLGENQPSVDEVRAWCGETLAAFKRPRVVKFVDELPRNPTGKVDKAALRARA